MLIPVRQITFLIQMPNIRIAVRKQQSTIGAISKFFGSSDVEK